MDLSQIRATKISDQQVVASGSDPRTVPVEVSVSKVVYNPQNETETVYSGSQRDVVYVRAQEEILPVPAMRGDKGERGEKGEPGTDGRDGTDGAPGATGNGIASITKTGTSGLVDTYTITYTDGDTDTFTVTNGADGASAWGQITGTLSDQTDLQDALDAKANSADLGTMAGIDDAPSNGNEYVRKNGDWSVASGGGGVWGSITGTLSDQTDLQTALNGKEDTLTFDSVPTDGSTNPVESNGIYDALAGKQDSLTFDSVPTDGSTNPVESNGIYDALATKQNTLTFDNVPTDSSSNPVTSDGIYDFVVSHADFKITGTASAGSAATFTDNRIDSDHWEPESVYFASKINVTSDLAWATNATNHTITLTATFAGATDVLINMHWVQ